MYIMIKLFIINNAHNDTNVKVIIKVMFITHAHRNITVYKDNCLFMYNYNAW